MRNAGNGNIDFTKAFYRTRAAVKLCMALVEAGNADSNTNEKAVWAAVDAIVEESCRDVKDIWKRRYAAEDDVPINGRMNGSHDANGHRADRVKSK